MGGERGEPLAEQSACDEQIAQIRRVLIHHRAGPLTRAPVTSTMSKGWYASVLRDIRAVLDGTYREPEPPDPRSLTRAQRLLVWLARRS